MADVDDRWYRTSGGRKLPTARHGKGKRWDARWRDDTGKPRYRAFERKLDAERFLAGLQADLLRGTYIDPARGKITLRSYAEQRWLPAQVHLRPNSAAGTRRRWTGTSFRCSVSGHSVPCAALTAQRSSPPSPRGSRRPPSTPCSPCSAR